jgi:hypothetical protein
LFLRVNIREHVITSPEEAAALNDETGNTIPVKSATFNPSDAKKPIINALHSSMRNMGMAKNYAAQANIQFWKLAMIFPSLLKRNDAYGRSGEVIISPGTSLP